MAYPDEEYQEVIKHHIERRLEKTIVQFLESLREFARNMKCQVGTLEDRTDDEYQWSFIVHTTEVPAEEVGQWHITDLGVDFIVRESLVHDGTHDGINFELSFQGDGGKTFGRIAPYNYTPNVWVPLNGDKAMKERLQLIINEAEYALEQCVEEQQAEHEKDIDNGLYGDDLMQEDTSYENQ